MQPVSVTDTISGSHRLRPRGYTIQAFLHVVDVLPPARPAPPFGQVPIRSGKLLFFHRILNDNSRLNYLNAEARRMQSEGGVLILTPYNRNLFFLCDLSASALKQLVTAYHINPYSNYS